MGQNEEERIRDIAAKQSLSLLVCINNALYGYLRICILVSESLCNELGFHVALGFGSRTKKKC